jgi:hypothetical protein
MSGKRRFDAVDPIVTTLMKKITGPAALHMLLMRVGWAKDAFAVFGWRNTYGIVYTMDDVKTRLHEMCAVLDGKGWKLHSSAVRKVLFPVMMSVFKRIQWAMRLVVDRLAEMDAQSDLDTDGEA